MVRRVIFRWGTAALETNEEERVRKEEEAKLDLTFITRCQKNRENFCSVLLSSENGCFSMTEYK